MGPISHVHVYDIEELLKLIMYVLQNWRIETEFSQHNHIFGLSEN